MSNPQQPTNPSTEKYMDIQFGVQYNMSLRCGQRNQNQTLSQGNPSPPSDSPGNPPKKPPKKPPTDNANSSNYPRNDPSGNRIQVGVQANPSQGRYCPRERLDFTPNDIAADLRDVTVRSVLVAPRNGRPYDLEFSG